MKEFIGWMAPHFLKWSIFLCVASIFCYFMQEELHEAKMILAADPKHAAVTTLLASLEWCSKVVVWGTAGFLLVGGISPILYLFYEICESRSIPGPLDDWFVALWSPLKNRITKEGFLFYLKWSGSICAIFGGCMVASKTPITPYGFIFLASSSGQWLLASLLMRDRPLIALNSFVFIFVDCHGIYRWLFS